MKKPYFYCLCISPVSLYRPYLEESARRSGQSKSELVRQALKRQLNIESFQQLRKELLPYGEAQGWLTDEDVFRDVS